MLKKQLRTGIFVLTILSIFAGTAKAYDVVYNTVYVTDNGEQARYRTSKDTVDEFFDNEGISLLDMDKVNIDLTASIRDDMRINITRAFNVALVIDGLQRKVVKTNEETVGGILSTLKEEDASVQYLLAEDYSLSQKAKPDMSIKVVSRREEVSEYTEAIPFETEIVEDNTMPVGTEQVKNPGEEGIRKITVQNVYVGNKLSSTKEISNIVTKEAVTQIVEKGTKQPDSVVETNAGTFKSLKKISMTATAYTSVSATSKRPGDPYYGITASGMKAARGVVAVDPKIIPLGTKLYVEGYGYAVAGDTGGAIKNNKIDLYYDTHNECIKFGRRTVTVHILGDKIA